MKNNKNAKIFDFSLLKYYQQYDKYIDESLINLIRIHPQLNTIIFSIKNAKMRIPQKIVLISTILKLVNYLYFNDERADFAERIANKLFCGSEEYRYRKQFSE